MIGQINELLSVAGKSLRYRRGGVALTVLSVAMSVFLLLTVEHVRQEARTGFASTVSGVDLIVGARTGEINLLLLSIFRIGNATANISADSVEAVADHENIEWVVPISLGDSHRGFRVVGTTADFFNRYKYGRSNSLGFSSGHAFNATEDIVLGHAVAAELGYDLADSIVLSHGVADTSFTHHDEAPFAVSGILAPTGTPVDNALFASLAAIDLIHDDGAQGEHDDDDPGEHKHDEHSHENEHGHRKEDSDPHAGQDHPPHTPGQAVTALLVGVNMPFATLQVQRWINELDAEALLAILPGVALAQLWGLLSTVETTLRGISLLVFVSALLGMIAMLLASMRERGYEIEILRSIGAPSAFILGLLMIEALLIVTLGVVIGVAGLLTAITVANSVLANEIGLSLSMQILHPSSLSAIGLIYLATVVLSLVPAWRAYRIATSATGVSRRS